MQTKDKLAKMEHVKIAHDHVDFTDRIKKGTGTGALITGDLEHNTAVGTYSHAEGYGTHATESYSHAEGINSTASGGGSHAEGGGTTASGTCAHAEGTYTKASGINQHVSGRYNIEDTNDTYAEIIGNGTAGSPSNARTLDWNGNEVLAGKLTLGANPTNDMDAATKKMVDDVDMSDRIKKGTGLKSVIEGNVASTTGVTGDYAHAEGTGTVATGENSHAEGQISTAHGPQSHAEGYSTNAAGANSHAEGCDTESSGTNSHAEGVGTTASGYSSHAENDQTVAAGDCSHADGCGTNAQRRSQHVFGEFNALDIGGSGVSDRGTYIEIVGCGNHNNNRSNARTLDWSGNEVLAGKLTVGAAPTADMDVATKKYIDDIISALRTELGLT